MKHIILGTAGHIDHGKTALIKALSGIECDTHREEKRRGITINLGFAHLALPGGETVGIVDVPGHRDFIHTMVAGASGIDIALLVVAADGGIMPQTREHVAIMDMLGIRRGLLAVSRIDLVEKELLAVAVEEVEEFVQDTFLDGCPVVPISSKSGEGIDRLKDAIASMVSSIDSRPGTDLFRMYIDRIFSVSGFGTVVTGSVLGGRARIGDQLYLLPDRKKVRIRRCERYGIEVSEVVGGDRASLNLVGLSKEEFVQGMMVADRPLRPTILLDARVELFDHTRILPLWSQVQFLTGTFESQARMHLIDANQLRPGKQAVAQLHLRHNCVVQAGDRFVIRSTSNDQTVGGGIIIDAAPLHHRRRPSVLVDKLHALADGSLRDLVAAEVRKYPHGVSRSELARHLNCSVQDVDGALDELPPDIKVLTGEKELFFIDESAYRVVSDRIVGVIEAYHRRNPLDPSGRTVEELQGMLGLAASPAHGQMVSLVLDRLEAERKLIKVQHTWALVDHNVDNAQKYRKVIDAVDHALESFGLKTPLEADIQEIARQQNLDDHFMRQVLNYLTAQKSVHHIEGAYLHASVVDPIRRRLCSELQKHPEGFTVAQFRDLIGGNRKICLLLYALFDREGITVRNGDVRQLTKLGRQQLSSLSGTG